MTFKNNYNQKVTSRQALWMAICGTFKVKEYPDYWVIEDLMYHQLWLLWMHARIEWARLPDSYDIPIITANVLQYIAIQAKRGHDHIIRKRITKLENEFRERFGEEPR